MKTTTQESPVLITEKEAARLLGCCERSVWQLRKDGKLRCVKIGTAVRYARTELDRFIQEQMSQN
ncbi:MAG: helix-turn-helix domain-containing protein [bacterium]|nr:helix-turn-helix domain-containing protein [bacterium]